VLVVKLEIWPGGDETTRKEIGRMHVSNQSELAEVSDYEAMVSLNGKRQRTKVRGHVRAHGAWELVWRVLDSMKARRI